MKFYDRKKELEILEKNRKQSEKSSLMTTMIGRRRIGKTSLLLKSVEKEKYLYLYVSKDSEHVLCQKFQQRAESELGMHIYGQIHSFGSLFEELMAYGRENHYTLIIDEFQNFLSINKAIPSEIQDVWDRMRATTHVNLILCGSIYSMMKKIFENGDEPLYGRRDSAITLKPFTNAVIKEILADHNPHFTAEDLLCLYMLTGGVAKYVSLLMDAKAFTKDKMLKYVTAPDSPFLTEGTEMLISEFNRDYGTYFSIMQLIAAGKTTQNEIDGSIGKNSGAYLSNLCDEYSFIKKNVPIFSKRGVRNIRWSIDDCFLRFWFRFVYPYQYIIESAQFELLYKNLRDNYEQFTGITLEQYFQREMMETGMFTRIGNWWDRRGENEIDLIAVNEFEHKGIVAEIKRNPKKINPSRLVEKIATLPSASFAHYDLQLKSLSMDDM